MKNTNLKPWIAKKLGILVHVDNPSTQEADQEDNGFDASLIYTIYTETGSLFKKKKWNKQNNKQKVPCYLRKIIFIWSLEILINNWQIQF